MHQKGGSWLKPHSSTLLKGWLFRDATDGESTPFSPIGGMHPSIIIGDIPGPGGGIISHSKVTVPLITVLFCVSKIRSTLICMLK